MYCSGVVAHGGQLLGLAKAGIRRIVDSLRRPDADEAICGTILADFLSPWIRRAHSTSSSSDKSLPIGRDMAAVNFKVLLLSAMREPYRADIFHDSNMGASAGGTCS